MTLNGVMAVTLRYFTEFGKPALQKAICGGMHESIAFLVRVQCRRKESSRSLSHLLMSFLFSQLKTRCCQFVVPFRLKRKVRTVRRYSLLRHFDSAPLYWTSLGEFTPVNFWQSKSINHNIIHNIADVRTKKSDIQVLAVLTGNTVVTIKHVSHQFLPPAN